MKVEEEIATQLARIPNRGIHAEVYRAVKAIADAIEMQPTGTGQVEVAVQSGGFESSAPSEVRLKAAEVERIARQKLKDIDYLGRDMWKTIHGGYVAPRPRKRGRPTEITADIICRARELATRLPVTATFQALTLEYGIGDSTLWAALGRGSTPSPDGVPSPSRLLYLAVYTNEEVRP
jgi:hypothetical protein